MPPNGKMCELINYICQPRIEHPVFDPPVGQCTTSLFVSVILGRGWFWHGSVYFATRSRLFVRPGPALGGAGPNWEQFRSAQVPSQLAPRSVEVGAGLNWEQLVQLA